MLRTLLYRLKSFFLWLWRQKGTPGERSRGVAVGVFSGCFPLFGLQTVLGVVLAGVFKGNRLLAVTGTWISNPLTYLPLYWFNYLVGSLIYREGPGLQSSSYLDLYSWLNNGWLIGAKVLAGSFIVGLVLALLSGTITYIILQQYQNKGH